jgi:uncharacterized membrane protein
MNYRKCNPLYGYRWFTEGSKLFLSQPWPWLALVGMTLLLLLMLSFLPLLGLAGIFALFPGIAAGFMFASRDALAQQTIGFSHLRAGFKIAPKPLLAVGGIAFFVFFLALILITIGWREQFMALVNLAQSAASDQEAVVRALNELTIPSIITVAVMLIIAIATWFVPALVVFRQLKPGAAISLSFRACLKNFGPFLVYSVLLVLSYVLISFALRLILAAVRGMGGEQAAGMLGLVISFPLICAFMAIIFASAYVSYVDVFEAAPKSD